MQGLVPVKSICGPRLSVRRLTDLSDNDLEAIPEDKSILGSRTLLLNCNRFSIIPSLKDFQCLEKLSLADNSLTHLTGLESLQKLKVLDLKHNNIFEVSGLEQLSSLEWLDVSENKIKDIECLSRNHSLQYINLSKNCVTELGNFSSLSHLKILLLAENLLTSILSVPNYLPPSITVLDISGNHLRDLTEMMLLQYLPVLEQFSLRNNPCIDTSDQSLHSEYCVYVLCWCKHLRILDGHTVTHFDRQRAKDLDLDGRIREMQPGQHEKLMKYLLTESVTSSSPVDSRIHGQQSKEASPTSPISPFHENETMHRIAWPDVDEAKQDRQVVHPMTLDAGSQTVEDLCLTDVGESAAVDSSLILSESRYCPVLSDVTGHENIKKSKRMDASESCLDQFKTLSWGDVAEFGLRSKEGGVPADKTSSTHKENIPVDQTSRVHFTPPTVFVVSPRIPSYTSKNANRRSGDIMTRPTLARPRKSPSRESMEQKFRQGTGIVRTDNTPIPLVSKTDRRILHREDEHFGKLERTFQSSPGFVTENVPGKTFITPSVYDREAHYGADIDNDSIHMSAEEAIRLLNLGATLIQAHFRGYLQRQRFRVQLREHRAAIKIQSSWRGYVFRNLNIRFLKRKFQLEQRKMETRLQSMEENFDRVSAYVQRQGLVIGELITKFDTELLQWQDQVQRLESQREEDENRFRQLSELCTQQQNEFTRLKTVVKSIASKAITPEPGPSGINDTIIVDGNYKSTDNLGDNIVAHAYYSGFQTLHIMDSFADQLSTKISKDVVQEQGDHANNQERILRFAAHQASDIINNAICEMALRWNRNLEPRTVAFNLRSGRDTIDFSTGDSSNQLVLETSKGSPSIVDRNVAECVLSHESGEFQSVQFTRDSLTEDTGNGLLQVHDSLASSTYDHYEITTLPLPGLSGIQDVHPINFELSPSGVGAGNFRSLPLFTDSSVEIHDSLSIDPD